MLLRAMYIVQETPTMLVYGEMSEDCLTLNVFVPVEDNQSQTSPRAVMVFIHGGGFYLGDAPTYRYVGLSLYGIAVF